MSAKHTDVQLPYEGPRHDGIDEFFGRGEVLVLTHESVAEVGAVALDISNDDQQGQELFVGERYSGDIALLRPVGEVKETASEDQKRDRINKLYQDDPELALAIAEGHVAGFSVQGSNSLHSFLRHSSLLTEDEQRKRGEAVDSGQPSIGVNARTDQVAFSDWAQPETLTRYAEAHVDRTVDSIESEILGLQHAIRVMEGRLGSDDAQVMAARQSLADKRRTQSFISGQSQPQNLREELMLEDFVVAYGVNTEGLDEVDYGLSAVDVDEVTVVNTPGSNYEGEFAISGQRGIDSSRIPVIAVSAEKRVRVQQLLEAYRHTDIRVVSIEPLLSSA